MKKALIGYGGHAREVSSITGIKTFFVQDEYLVEGAKPLSTLDISKYEVMIAIGDPIVRKRIVESLPKTTKYFTYVHPTSFVFDKETCIIGEGSYIGPNSILTTNIQIGKHSLLNRANQIGHDTIIEDYLTMMPGSIISGTCKIGYNFYIGTNSSVKENLIINSNVTIGLNSGVVANIAEKGKYGGTPCKKLR